jgi:hypothetical protein
MAECQSRGVKGLPWSSSSDQLGPLSLDTGDSPASAPAIHRIAHDRVSHVLQMEANLVSPAGVQLQPKEVDDIEPGHHRRISARRPP